MKKKPELSQISHLQNQWKRSFDEENPVCFALKSVL